MGTIIFAIIFLVLGILILWSCINQFSDSRKKLKWLLADAQISESSIGSSKDLFSVYSTPAKNLKKVFVKYAYTINDKEYTDQIPISLKSNYLPLIEKQLEKYPVGKPLKVYYNPKNPEESQLNKPGLSFGSIFGYLFFFSLGLFLFGYSIYGIVIIIL